jgi:hypothetical protein
MVDDLAPKVEEVERYIARLGQPEETYVGYIAKTLEDSLAARRSLPGLGRVPKNYKIGITMDCRFLEGFRKDVREV